ncbi:PTS cellobiose transporter subunit IIC [Maledivibacter halophilus]|uniref:Permease IIC component n=1 Tax=Maledivibacter halophilus TaxID=36842 RepID=A0A1T5K067_9FIRM|nr:PTS cellobiose transporter subunit IIC [Maledivibacter halophilus]SKC56869.1 PTS system, cellobiose-specific IIC component [Maledivibacter halophilus]
MGKINSFLEEKVMPVAGRIADQKHLQSIRDGLILAMPLLIIGSLFLIIGFLPIPGYNDFMAGVFGEMWKTRLLYPVGATFDIMAIFASFGIAYRLAERYEVDPLSAGAISLAAFMLVTPHKIMFAAEGAAEAVEVGGVIPVGLMGSKGLFVAMFIALISTEIYRKIVQKNIIIKMPEGVPPAVSKSFAALIPALVVITVVWILRIGLEHTSFEHIHNVVGDLLTAPLSKLGGSLGGALVGVFLIDLLWTTGLHGSAVVGAVMNPIWLSLMDQNRMVFQADPTAALPNIVTLQFLDLWVFVGGSGATLVLAILLAFKSKSKQLKNLGKLSLGAGIFNINEPIVFGTPIVMNPILMIPFIFVPLVITLISYMAMKLGLVALPCGVAVPWTTPMLISGYLATGGRISGAVLQLVNFIIALALYYPFFKMWDNKKLEEENSMESEK